MLRPYITSRVVPESLIGSLFFGLASAGIWGAGDFCGGLGARRASVLTVLLIGQATGLVMLIAAGVLFGDPVPTPGVVAWGVAAGIAGTIGVAALYRGLAVGRASVVAPVSAVVGALLPATYSAITVGLPGAVKLVGFIIALASITLISQSHHETGKSRALHLALLAGAGFGGFFIFIAASGTHSTFLPLAVARTASLPLVLVAALARGLKPPSADSVPIIVLSGLLDAGGNIFLLLAIRFGRLDVASIVSSLYPASTVILSRVVLGERTTRLQQLGVVAALLAIGLIAA